MFKRYVLVPVFLVLVSSLIFVGPAISKAPEATEGVTSPAKTLAHLAAPSPEQRRNVLEAFGNKPLSFVENRGQADKHIAYYIQTPGNSLYFTPDGYAQRLSQGKGSDAKAHTIKVEFVDAAPERIESLERAPGIVNFFGGPKAQWKSAIPTHAKIGYVQPWPGIDLSYDGHGGKLESIYTVAPHADPAQIKLRYSGQESLRLDAAGNLVYTTSLGEVKETAPILYQEIEGQRIPVEGRYVLLDEDTVSFKIATYDPEHTLVIDPTLVYAGYIGGSSGDFGSAIAVDSAGNAYVTGQTDPTGIALPVQDGTNIAIAPTSIFVAKVDPNGVLVYTSLIGGDGYESGRSIAVDGVGNAYVTGQTSSTESTFPVLIGPDLTHNGNSDAFIAKLGPSGSLIYAGYIGGSGDESGAGIAVDSSGNAYVTGFTTSTEASFPILGGPDLTYSGGENDAFVAKLGPNGNLIYVGYIGGSGYDESAGIAVDSGGNAYITGRTSSDEATFPVLGGPGLAFNGGLEDAFVAKLGPNGNLTYAGYIGGSGYDEGAGIAVDSVGNAYVTGYTTSTETSFPILGGPNLTFNGGYDAFVAKVAPSGSALIYAGYIGGSGDEFGAGIAVDSVGNAYVTGYTTSTETSFPAHGGPDLTFNGGLTDAFVAKVAPSGSALTYAGYIGGSGDEFGAGIAVDSVGNAYVTGYTSSTESSFPVLGGPDLTFNGVYDYDAFVAKIADSSAVQYTLTVSKAGAGAGAGAVSSAGIDCGTDCSEPYNDNTVAVLTASAATGTVFAGWSGDADCADGSVTMNADKTCIATFDLLIAPAAPSSLTALAASTASIALTWLDSANNEEGFEIERKAGACGSANAWALLATTGANLSTHIDSGLALNTRYAYRVRSYNAAGNSAYSKCVSATTTVVAAPTISSVSPNPVTGSNIPQTITINGTGFTNKPSLTLTWTGQPGVTLPMARVTYVSDTQVQMLITTRTMPDTWTVKAANPDGQTSNTLAFTVVAP